MVLPAERNGGAPAPEIKADVLELFRGCRICRCPRISSDVVEAASAVGFDDPVTQGEAKPLYSERPRLETFAIAFAR
jgi:hypothetical protein